MAKANTPAERTSLMRSGQINSDIRRVLEQAAAPGVTGSDLDAIVMRTLDANGALPAWQTVGFPGAVCISVNNVIAHGVPSEVGPLKEGDIVHVDVGVLFEGWITDSGTTFTIGPPTVEQKNLMDGTRAALRAAERVLSASCTPRHVGEKVAAELNTWGLEAIRDLGGHGVGRNVHEEPWIPSFVPPKHLEEFDTEFGYHSVIAVEPNVSPTTSECYLDGDWHIMTTDGSIAAQFEHTYLLTETGFIRVTE